MKPVMLRLFIRFFKKVDMNFLESWSSRTEVNINNYWVVLFTFLKMGYFMFKVIIILGLLKVECFILKLFYRHCLIVENQDLLKEERPSGSISYPRVEKLLNLYESFLKDHNVHAFIIPHYKENTLAFDWEKWEICTLSKEKLSFVRLCK